MSLFLIINILSDQIGSDQTRPDRIYQTADQTGSDQTRLQTADQTRPDQIILQEIAFKGILLKDLSFKLRVFSPIFNPKLLVIFNFAFSHQSLHGLKVCSKTK